MGYFYVGGKTNQRTNAYVKIGETNQERLIRRIQNIRCKEGNFSLFKYLVFENSTKALTKAVEGHTRFMLEKIGYKNIQNDHFEWRTTPAKKKKEYAIFADNAIKYAIEYCEMMGISYQLCEGDYNLPFNSTQEYLNEVATL